MSSSANLIFQYIAVGIIFLGALAWTVVKLIKLNKKGGACCGCDLANACNKRVLKKTSYESCHKQSASKESTDTEIEHENNKNLEQ